jgi:hypothetical protein
LTNKKEYYFKIFKSKLIFIQRTIFNKNTVYSPPFLLMFFLIKKRFPILGEGTLPIWGVGAGEG